MLDKYKKTEHETEFDYGLRLIEIKCEENPQDLDWEDIVSLLNLNIHRDSLRKACNTTPFSSYKVMKYFKKKIEEIVDKEDKTKDIEELQSLIKQLQVEKQELYKEKTKMQDQKREIRGLLRTQARWEHLIDIIEKNIEKLNNEIPLERDTISYTIGENIASLLLSDFHVGMEIDTNINKYNMSIFQERLNKLKGKVIQYCNLHGVSTLNIEILGDIIQGYLHINSNVYNEEDVISQTMFCAENLAFFLKDLSEEIENINIYFSVGNHGRTNANYKEHLDVENFEYIILWFLKSRLNKINNIEFKENIIDGEIIHYKVFDKTICAIHGHKDKIDSVKKDLSTMVGELVDEVHMGHYHNFISKDDVIVNGALSGVDRYAISKRFNSEPMQVLKIYSTNNDEIIYKINVR